MQAKQQTKGNAPLHADLRNLALKLGDIAVADIIPCSNTSVVFPLRNNKERLKLISTAEIEKAYLHFTQNGYAYMYKPKPGFENILQSHMAAHAPKRSANELAQLL